MSSLPFRWSIVSDKLGRRVFERPLGLTEAGFHWDSVFERTADTLQHALVQVVSDSSDSLFSVNNVTRAWTALKRRFPILAVRVEERGPESVFFVLDEERLQVTVHNELCFGEVSTDEQAKSWVDQLLNNKEHLSHNLLASMVVLKQNNSGLVHLLQLVAHCITDGMSNISILKTFLDELCNIKTVSKLGKLEDRLKLAAASEDLVPNLRFTSARRNWRIAIASVIAAQRATRMVPGGHSIPRKVSQQTPYTPAASKSLGIVLPKDLSDIILRNCRIHKITFGNAYPIIGQIAIARVLLRRYLRGEISESEWKWRKKEPMMSAGPLNLRPFLDREWNEAGGQSNAGLCISFFFYKLPFLPLGEAASLKSGASVVPGFEAMLSKKRFLFRANAVRVQAENFLRHPLFVELASSSLAPRINRLKTIALHHRGGIVPDGTSRVLLCPQEQAAGGMVFGNTGSSIGNLDRILPLRYPTNQKISPQLEILESKTRLHCRPTELYLGAATSRQHLTLTVHWDNNVFDEGTVQEWLEEVKAATVHYLGQDEMQVAHL